MIPSSCRAGECLMRGCDHQSGSLFSYVDLETRIRPDHPLRTIRRLVDDALASLDRAFTDLYAAPATLPCARGLLLCAAHNDLGGHANRAGRNVGQLIAREG